MAVQALKNIQTKENEAEITALLRFLDYAEGFNLAFVRCNIPIVKDYYIRIIKELAEPLKIDALEIDITGENVKDVRLHLKNILKRIPAKEDFKQAIFLKGVGWSAEKYPQIFTRMNFDRDLYLDDVPHPLIFWLHEEGLKKLLQTAPDFARYHSGSFDLTANEDTREKLKQWVSGEDVVTTSSLKHEEKEVRINLLKRLLSEYETSEDKNEKRNLLSRAHILHELGRAYYYISDFQTSIDYHEQSLKITRVIGNRRGEGSNLANLAMVYDDLGEFEKSISYYEQGLKIVRQSGDRRTEGLILSNIGNFNFRLGDLEKASNYYEKALSIAHEIGNLYGEGIALSNLGNIYGKLGRFEQAIDYFQKAISIAREIHDRQSESTLLGNLGSIYGNLGKFENAKDYFEQALKISRELGNRDGEGHHLNSLGTTYENLGDYVKALSLFVQALQILEKIQSPESKDVQENIENLSKNLGKKTYRKLLKEVKKNLSTK